MLKSGLILAAGRMGGVAFAFARNVLLARLIGVEDYGIASTFILISSLIEGLSDLALDRFAIQDRDGNSRSVVGAIQLLLLIRGLLLAIIIVLLAEHIAVFLGQPTLGWAYRLIAIVPIMRALVHLDTARLQRTMRFGLRVMSDMGGILVSLLAVWPLWLWLGDYRAMLGVQLIDFGVRTAVSYLFAERPYYFGWDRTIVIRALRFGWPLLLGGLFVFLIHQGGRLIVANQFSAVELGLFSAALSVTLTPTLAVLGVANSMFLPLLANEQDNLKAFRERTAVLLETLLVCGLGMMLAYVFIGPILLPLVYGPDFAEGARLVAILGITFTLLMIRSGPSNISLAKANTINLFLSNGVRLISFPIAFFIAIRGGSVEAVAFTGLVAEVVSLVLANFLSAARDDVWPEIAQRAPVFGLAMLLIAFLAARAMGWMEGLPSAIAAVVLFAAIFALCREFRGTLAILLRQILQRLS